jgi:hypothetical protein
MLIRDAIMRLLRGAIARKLEARIYDERSTPRAKLCDSLIRGVKFFPGRTGAENGLIPIRRKLIRGNFVSA